MNDLSAWALSLPSIVIYAISGAIGGAIGALLLTLLMSSTAMAWDQKDENELTATYNSLAYALMAQFTGSQKYNRCPRFRVIDEATKAELAAARLKDNPNEAEEQSGFIEKYANDPSAFCKRAWEVLGPNGTYKRQMLEAK